MRSGGTIVALVAVVLLLSAPALHAQPTLRERMPEVSRAVLVLEREIECATASITAKYYNTRGDGDSTPRRADVALYFAPSVKKPFMAAVWAPPEYRNLDRLLMDLNLNEYADVVGLPGDDAFGFNPCDGFMYWLENKKR